jgi:hypothetical protein
MMGEGQIMAKPRDKQIEPRVCIATSVFGSRAHPKCLLSPFIDGMIVKIVKNASHLIVKLIQQAAQGSMRCTSARRSGKGGGSIMSLGYQMVRYSVLKCRGINEDTRYVLQRAALSAGTRERHYAS